jgi:hypothetical protein
MAGSLASSSQLRTATARANGSAPNAAARRAVIGPPCSARVRTDSCESYLAGAGYTWLPGREATEIAPNAVRDHTGAWHQGDLVILCPGAAHTGVAGRYLARSGVRRVRLQMMQTAPLAERITTALADGDSLRYYPAYDLPGRAQLPPQAAGAGHPASSCCWSSGPTAGSPSGTRTNTPSHSRSTSTRTPTTTSSPGPRRCSARPSRGCSDAGPGSTVRWTPAWPPPRFTTGPRSSPALSWSPGQAGVA